MKAIVRLTERQKDCLRLVGEGYTSKEIGRKLEISPATVDNHVRLALEVLQAPGRAEAAVNGYRTRSTNGPAGVAGP